MGNVWRVATKQQRIIEVFMPTGRRYAEAEVDET
jgi:hypothetical protein